MLSIIKGWMAVAIIACWILPQVEVPYINGVVSRRQRCSYGKVIRVDIKGMHLVYIQINMYCVPPNHTRVSTSAGTDTGLEQKKA